MDEKTARQGRYGALAPSFVERVSARRVRSIEPDPGPCTGISTPTRMGRACPTVRERCRTYDASVSQSTAGSAPRFHECLRAVAYVIAVGTRTLLAVAVCALSALPILIAAIDPSLDAVPSYALAVAGLAMLGVGLPIVSATLARADWSGAAALEREHRPEMTVDRPNFSLVRPKSLVRPLAYSIAMITLGGALTATGVLVVIGSTVAVVSPYLTLTGDVAVLGPVTVTTVPQSLVAAGVGIFALTLVASTSPRLAHRHAQFVEQVLTRPEQRLRHDLNATAQSRARLVRSFDVERRRIERDLHDAVQPQILSVSMSLGLALAELPVDSPVRGDIARAQQQARRVLDDLRRVVRNIHPRVLVDHGLGAAVREIADNFAVAVTVDDLLGSRLPPDIETSLYFCVSELLSNVVKHSTARSAMVVLRQLRGNEVQIAVHDDGCGGADTRFKAGGGLSGIADRLAAVGGTLAIDSPHGGPTNIIVAVPHVSSA